MVKAATARRHAESTDLLAADVGQRIREVRQAQGLSLAQLGGEDLSRSFLSLVETGRSRISLRALAIVANRLNMPVSYFLAGSRDTADTAARVLIEEAEISFGRRQPEECLRLLDEAQRTSETVAPARIRLLRGRSYVNLGRIKDAVSLLLEGIQEIEQDDDAHFRAEYRFALGGALYVTGRYDEAHLHLRRALDDVHESGEDPVLTGKIMVIIGHILFVQRDIDAAITHYRSAVDLFGSVRDYHTQGTIYAGLSLAMKRKGELDAALEYAQLGAALFRAGNEIRDMAALLNNMAVALQEHGDLDRAADVAEQALARAQQAGAVDVEAIVHGTLASIYLAGGDLEAAGQEAALAGDLSRDDSDPARIDSWSALAQIAEQQGNTERADTLFKQALEQLKQSGRWTRYGEVALAYTDILQQRGDIAGALHYAREAAKLQVSEAAGR